MTRVIMEIEQQGTPRYVPFDLNIDSSKLNFNRNILTLQKRALFHNNDPPKLRKKETTIHSSFTPNLILTEYGRFYVDELRNDDLRIVRGIRYLERIDSLSKFNHKYALLSSFHLNGFRILEPSNYSDSYSFPEHDFKLPAKFL